MECFREIFHTTSDDGDGATIVKPVILNKSSTNGGENPFGATFCYGTGQLIVEVMDNSHLATVIIYEDQRAIMCPERR